MNKKPLIILVLAIVIVLVLGFLVWERQGITIITDKKEYESGGILRVNIKNNLRKDICFSSCYPYILENKETKWQAYEYEECPEPNLAERCMKPTEIKGFELTLSKAKNGLHRLAIPICIDCKEKDEFKETKRFYSNKFIIK